MEWNGIIDNQKFVAQIDTFSIACLFFCFLEIVTHLLSNLFNPTPKSSVCRQGQIQNFSEGG